MMKAFPNPTLADPQSCSSEILNAKNNYGMDLRDYFAAKAMQGFCTKSSDVSGIVKTAYEVADAMMKARGE